MRWIILLLLLLPLPLPLPLASAASPVETWTAESPPNRVVLLELYTSEGCSSCPPADRFLSSLKQAGVSNRQLVPLAFHVTYWDYIGWRDRFANSRYDRRQRRQAKLNARRTIYTPQFLFNGADFRDHAGFSERVSKAARQPAEAGMQLKVTRDGKRRLDIAVRIDNRQEQTYDLWLAVFENNLSSDVRDGENAGATLHHDYVVRALYGPFKIDSDNTLGRQQLLPARDWKTDDLGVAAFLQRPEKSEVVQAVSLMLGH